MIFTKYLVNEMLKNQLIILLVLFLVFFSQKFVHIFSLIVNNGIPKFYVFIFFGLSIPEVFKFILPVSLFFSILITFNYLHVNNEIIAMYACGFSNFLILRGILFLIMITMSFSMVNLLFLSPFCLRYQNQLMSQYQSSIGTVRFFEGKFQFLKNLNSMFFIDSCYGNKFKDVFLIQVRPDGYHSIIVSDYGYMQRESDHTSWIILGPGNYYSWSRDSFFMYSNFYCGSFDQHKFSIDNRLRPYHKNDPLVTEMFISQLWNSSKLEARGEFHWRLTLFVVVFIMAMIISPLSLMQIHMKNSYFFNVCPAIVLYLMFFLLQIFLRVHVSKGNITPFFVWFVNGFYMFLALILNLWDSVIFRNIRWKFKLFYN